MRNEALNLLLIRSLDSVEDYDLYEIFNKFPFPLEAIAEEISSTISIIRKHVLNKDSNSITDTDEIAKALDLVARTAELTSTLMMIETKLRELAAGRFTGRIEVLHE